MKITSIKLLSSFLFLFCCLFQSLNAQTLETLIRNNDIKQLAEILNNPLNSTRNEWIHNEKERHTIIGFCDHAIHKSLRISINDYKYYKRSEEPPVTSIDTLVRKELNWYLKDSKYNERKNDTIPKIKKEEFQNIGYQTIMDFMRPLISFLQMDTVKRIYEIKEMDLSIIKNHFTIQLLYNNYEHLINTAKLKVPEAILNRNLQLIADRMAAIESKEFVLYRSHAVKDQKLKTVEFFTDNDFLQFMVDNQDREFTGGGGLSISTDYLKWRWLNFGWLLKNSFKKGAEKLILNNRQVLTYQSLKLGMNFYTPYIRYRNNYTLADSMFKHDRPFASYINLERAKYRLWPKGLVRHQGHFQVGLIGSNAGRDIQATLHKDATVSSQKVYGWENQIAHGGRWLIQLNHTLDLMLYSSNNPFQTIFKPNKRNSKHCYMGLNVYNSNELFFGGYYTAFGTGMFVSLLDFTKQSGQNMIAVRKRNQYDFGINIQTGVRYRYIMHNSMLEGLGYTGTFLDDPYDDEAETSYVLSPDQINRNIFLWETKLNLRWRKMVLFYSMTLQSKEYKLDAVDYNNYKTLVSPEDQTFYEEIVVPELNTFKGFKSYGYGRIGLTWIL